MIRLAALNEETGEENRTDEDVTKEALEQIALKQYSKALELRRSGNLPDATQLLKDLLETGQLHETEKSPNLSNLKYLCNKNLGSMLASACRYEEAVECYSAAADLDGTDLNLWVALGTLYVRVKHYSMALQSFQTGCRLNPRHWRCLDQIIMLQLGLDHKKDCIKSIYHAFSLDPNYQRGIVYRQYIISNFSYMRQFIEECDRHYKWNGNDNFIDDGLSERLLKEADEIHITFLEQQKAEQVEYLSPRMKLQKPITMLTWESVGRSLQDMHSYLKDNSFCYSCIIDLEYEKAEPMKVCDDVKEQLVVEKSQIDENQVEKPAPFIFTAEPPVESNAEKTTITIDDEASDVQIEPEIKKKPSTRRRGSALSFLDPWEWCEKRRSRRKKPVTNRQDNYNENIYDTLRKMVPPGLAPEESQTRESESLSDQSDALEKEQIAKEDEYFGTELEEKDVQEFINKYTESKKDIIVISKDYLKTLAQKWKFKWPNDLAGLFIAVNEFYKNYLSALPTHNGSNEDLLDYIFTNLLVEEFSVNSKLDGVVCEKQVRISSDFENIEIILNQNPDILEGNFELNVRYLWVKLHMKVLNKQKDLALDTLYQLQHKLTVFKEQEQHKQNNFSLNLVNFTFKPIINENEISTYIKFLERNNKLATVMDLYKRKNYEEVLSIVIDSYQYCKNMAKKQEAEISIDFAMQLTLILDTYWALQQIENCFQWTFICLHEALKHYFRYTSGSEDYNKWTAAVVKILSTMELILINHDLSILDSVPKKELSQGLEDLIRIIGHQMETNAAEMPFNTVTPWILMYYIFQREEDQGLGKTLKEIQAELSDEVPMPLMVLFLGHDYLGNRGWCGNSDGKLLYFILNVVTPQLRSPFLSKCREQLCQYLEQVVYCLFGHPEKKNRVKHLIDHDVTPFPLDWKRAQQVYEVFRPETLPELEGKVSGITADTEQLFHRILALLPAECDLSKYVTEIEKYIKGTVDKLPSVPQVIPYKMKDIYFLLGDYYFKKEDCKLGIKFNILDVAVNKERLESWAEISLAKAVNLERILNSCKNLNNEREYLIPAQSVIRCFKRSLALDPHHCNIWIEYGIFVYTVHSFCSRLLKQASESLSMERFEALEKQKEDMLASTHKCFMAVLRDINNSSDAKKANEESWLHYYMLGKVAEKQSKPPSEYLKYYMQAVHSLKEADATYPLKINYSAPTHLSIEVLELHYRIHASILKYIEQHENKPIPVSVGKVFNSCIEEWINGPFSKKTKKDTETEIIAKPNDTAQAGNILKRSASVPFEDEPEGKKAKLDAAAAKVKRSVSYDTERSKETVQEAQITDQTGMPTKVIKQTSMEATQNRIADISQKSCVASMSADKALEKQKEMDLQKKGDHISSNSSSSSSSSSSSDSSSNSSSDSSKDSEVSSKSLSTAKTMSDEDIMKIVSACIDALEDCASRFLPHYKAIYRLAHYHFYFKKGKDIERCRDLMLSNFTTRAGQKLLGLFSERKTSNFFNNIWKIPHAEVDRSGGFAFHMSRSVLLTMEILKEIDDHKTLLDLSLQLQRIPEPDKKYVRDSDREELAQQASSLCVQSLRGQLMKFSQQADLKSNDIEQKALKSLMLDIYRAYQRAQKQSNSKLFVNLLVDAYKLVITTPVTETMNLVDLSMKYCQSLIQLLKQQATQASIDKSHKSQNVQKKHTTKVAIASEAAKTVINTQPARSDPKPTMSVGSVSGLPIAASQSKTLQAYMPLLNDPIYARQAADALTLIGSLLSPFRNPTESIIPNANSYQAEFYRQYISNNLNPFNIGMGTLPPKKQRVRSRQAKEKTDTSTLGDKSRSNRLDGKSVDSSAVHPSLISSGTNSKMSLSSGKHVSVNSALSSLPSSITASVVKPVPGLQTKSKSAPTMGETASTSKAGVRGPSTSVSNAPAKQAPASSALTKKPISGKSLKPKTAASLVPSMGTVLANLPAGMAASLAPGSAPAAHRASSTSVTATTHAKPPLPYQPLTAGKTLQEKLAERQKNMPTTSNSKRDKVEDLKASISKLPFGLTIVKTSQTKKKKIETKTAAPFDANEVIVLDDD